MCSDIGLFHTVRFDHNYDHDNCAVYHYEPLAGCLRVRGRPVG